MIKVKYISQKLLQIRLKKYDSFIGCYFDYKSYVLKIKHKI